MNSDENDDIEIYINGIVTELDMKASLRTMLQADIKTYKCPCNEIKKA